MFEKGKVWKSEGVKMSHIATNVQPSLKSGSQTSRSKWVGETDYLVSGTLPFSGHSQVKFSNQPVSPEQRSPARSHSRLLSTRNQSPSRFRNLNPSRTPFLRSWGRKGIINLKLEGKHTRTDSVGGQSNFCCFF